MLRRIFAACVPVKKVVFLFDTAYASRGYNEVRQLLEAEHGPEFEEATLQTSFEYKKFSRQFIVTSHEVMVDSLTGMVFEGPGTLIADSTVWPHDYLMRTFAGAPGDFRWRMSVLMEGETLVLPSSGYYHWLIEDLPNFLKAVDSRRSSKPSFITFQHSPIYVKEAMKCLDLQNELVPRFFRSREHSYCTFGQDLNYPRPSSLNILLDHFGSHRSQNDGIKIYVSRRYSSRSPSWEKDLERMLHEDGWQIVLSEKISFTEQISTFSRASIVCGVHGANLANIVWSHPNTRVIELTPKNRDIPGINRIALLRGLKYSEMVYESGTQVGVIYDEISKLI